MTAYSQTTIRQGAEETRKRLIRAGLKHFGLTGFEATPLRRIVGEAGQNVASVKYHFGSKDGLFDACVLAAAQRLGREGPGAVIDPAWAVRPPNEPDAARRIIRQVIDASLRHAMRPELSDEIRFLQREIITGSRGTDVFFDAVLADHISILASLVAAAENCADDMAHARLRAVSIILETMAILTAPHIVLRALGWSDLESGLPALAHAIYPDVSTSDST